MKKILNDSVYIVYYIYSTKYSRFTKVKFHIIRMSYQQISIVLFIFL